MSRVYREEFALEFAKLMGGGGGGGGAGGGGGEGGSTPNKPFFDPQAHSALLKPGGFLGSHPLFHNMEPFPRPPAGDFHQALR